jgi:RNA polymerase sigma-70 factor, ECF subfamily
MSGLFSLTAEPPAGHEPDVDSATALLGPLGLPAGADERAPARRRPAPPPIPQAAARGQALDFTGVYDEHFPFVWRSLRRLGVPERLLDDAAQDVFIVVHRQLAGFEGRSTLRSWLFGVARRVAHDHRRRIGRKERTEELPEGVADPRAPSPAAQVERAQALRTLHEILDALDDDKREVFVLAELEQMTVPEIADAIGANVNTIYSRLRAARAAFEAAVARRRARQAAPTRGAR